MDTSIEWRIHGNGATLGRAGSNDWILPDSERFVSGQHACIEFRDGGYYLVDISSNGTYRNGSDKRMERGAPVLIQNGDVYTLGSFHMAARIENDYPGDGKVVPLREKGPLELLKRILECKPFQHEQMEHLLGTRLVMDGTNGYFDSHVGGGGSWAFVTEVDLRLPGHLQTQSDGMISFYLTGEEREPASGYLQRRYGEPSPYKPLGKDAPFSYEVYSSESESISLGYRDESPVDLYILIVDRVRQ
ncbi:MAG: FHA domain-containing protein [Candidatus Sedimenticola sp. 1PA]